MTREEEVPDPVGAQEFYDKYETKEILGRYCMFITTLINQEQRKGRRR